MRLESTLSQRLRRMRRFHLLVAAIVEIKPVVVEARVRGTHASAIKEQGFCDMCATFLRSTIVAQLSSPRRWDARYANAHAELRHGLRPAAADNGTAPRRDVRRVNDHCLSA
jgi:hypothetical protein